MIAIESMATGADIDRAILEIVGGNGFPLPRFSTDWNDAMFAADLCGLMTDGRFIDKEGCAPNAWTVLQHDPECPDEPFVVASAPTGPLAICRAILKLTEGTL